LSGKFRRDTESPEDARRAKFDFPPVDKEKVYRIVDVMADVAAAHDVSVARIALAWLLHQDGVTSVIIGAKRMEQLEDNLASTEVELTEDELDRLDEVSALAPEYPGWMLHRQSQDRIPRSE
jgi:aryl-alcohol dehydrogenase-like predicted oxidoreductase